MDVLELARWQFGITTVYHFLMVPLTIGLSVMVAWFQTRWYRTGQERYLRLTKFFGKLFLINFAMGVVTGIVQEFQFGMTWSAYSRFVGDVFGAPLAMEALVAFFLESTFLGVWIFGWGRISPRLHLAAIWAAAIGTWISAYFILAANSWMQHPVGVRFNPDSGRAEMIDIWAVLTNNTTLSAFPHVIAGSLLTGAVFVAGISLWYLLRRNPSDVDRTGFTWSLRFSLWVAVVASAGILVSGHYQSHLMFQQQPMKMAAAEALCNTEAGAGLSIFAIGDVGEECDVRSVVIPGVVAFLATGDAGATIPGVLDVNAASAEKYGEGDYRPSLFITYWGFRGMIGLGFVALGAALFGLWKTRNGRVREFRWAGVLSLAIIPVPFLANSLGWIFTEMGRQPWVVAPNPTGIPEVRLLTRDAVSASVGSGLVLTSLIGFTVVYGVLAVVEVGLLKRYASAGPDAAMPPEPSDDDTFTFAY